MSAAVMQMLIGAGGLDADALAWRDRVVTAGGTVSATTLAAVSSFVTSCKAASIWTKLQRANLFCGGSLTAALVPLVNTVGNTTDTNVNFVSGDYVETGSSTGGLKGNGSTKYLNTGFNPVSASSSSSSFHIAAYVKGTESAGTTRYIVGNYGAGGSNVTAMGWVLAGSKESGGIAVTSGTEYAPSTSAAADGFLTITTNGSRSQQYYLNGSARSTPETATGSFTSNSIYISAANGNGTPDGYATRYLRAYTIGTGLSSSDVSALNTAMQAFQTALTRNV